MCYTDNSADHVRTFLNAQLGSLWENAVACLKKLEAQHRLDVTPNRYSVALEKYIAGRPRSGTLRLQDFEATFNKPSLRFVCNHDVILELTIKECQYTTSSSDHGRFASIIGRAGRNNLKTLEDVQVHLRVPFKRSVVHGGTSIPGAGHGGVKLLSLDFNAPSLHYISPSVEETDCDAIVSHLKGYLKLLQRAGHHVLFSLPEFNDAGLHYTIDFSSVALKSDAVDTVFGIPIENINTSLAVAWRNAVILSVTSSKPSETGSGLALAEYRSIWSPRKFGTHFHILFAAPTVVALCNQEVLITFNVDSVTFFDDAHPGSDKPLKRFNNWKLAFLCTIKHEQTRGGGCVLRLVIEQSDHHYMECFSEFPGYNAEHDKHELRSRFRNFFVTEYLIRIQWEELHILYDSDVILEIEFPLPDDGPGRPEDEHDHHHHCVRTREEMSSASDVGVFDVVSAISQAALNLHFRSSWEHSYSTRTTWSSMVTKWTHSEVFEAHFKPMSVRLLSNQHAIIFIYLESGYLKVGEDGLDKDADSYAFSDWRLAFEVPLVQCGHSDVPGVDSSWKTRFRESLAYQGHGKTGDREFHHIYANFRDAEFVPSFSQFHGPFSEGVIRETITTVKALLTLVRNHYLPLLMTAGYHVLHTIPVWKGGNAHAGAFTDFHFRVLSETVVTWRTMKACSYHHDPVIVIAGVTSGKSLPPLHQETSLHWLVRMGRALHCGTVCLSNRLFLRPKVLELFSAVNAMTTMVPFFTGLNGPNWGLRLVPWAEDEDRKHVSTNFKLEENTGIDDELRYDWQHEARWTYEQLGSSWTSQQKYIASCM